MIAMAQQKYATSLGLERLAKKLVFKILSDKYKQ